MKHFNPDKWMGDIETYANAAVAFAKEEEGACWFDFNGLRIEVQPGHTKDDVLKTWQAATVEASRIYDLPENVEARRVAAEKAKQAADEKYSAFVGFVKTADEKALRACEVPWPRTEAQLTALIQALNSRPHDYGTVCYAVSIATAATFNYMSGVNGITGFQASCADLDVLRRSRGIKGGFKIVEVPAEA